MDVTCLYASHTSPTPSFLPPLPQEDIGAYLVEHNTTVELLLTALQQMFQCVWWAVADRCSTPLLGAPPHPHLSSPLPATRKYKMMDTIFENNKRGLLEKLPDIISSLEAVQMLADKAVRWGGGGGVMLE